MADNVISKTFQFELVSPEKLLASEEAGMVIVPGEEGEFGALPGHAPFLSSLRPGVVRVHTPTGEVKRIFVAGGFADVGPAICSILAEEAVNVAELDRTDVDQRLKSLNDELAAEKDDAVRAATLQKQIVVEQAKLAALAA